MSDLNDFLHVELILPGIEAVDRTDAIQQIASQMHSLGYVKDSYLNAVLEREESFPTGLTFEDGTIAIPHSDIEHCSKPALALGVLNTPVDFFEMATLDVVVKTKLIFQLSILVPDHQVQWLSRLVNLCQKPGFITSLESVSSAQEGYDLLFGELRKEENIEESSE